MFTALLLIFGFSSLLISVFSAFPFSPIFSTPFPCSLTNNSLIIKLSPELCSSWIGHGVGGSLVAAKVARMVQALASTLI